MTDSGSDLADRRDLETTVYQPAEDSRLLASAAVTRVRANRLVLDCGTGSGYVGATVADETGATVVGSDLNPHACHQARDRGLRVVRADLLDPFEANAFDVVLFNPPYLPTEPNETRDDWMTVALSGGESGRAVIEPFLGDVSRVLRDDGVVFLLVSSLTGVDRVIDRAAEEAFSAVAVRDESFPFETLTVVELVR